MQSADIKRLLSLLTLLLFFVSARAWTPGLTEAAQAMAAGGATPAQELLVFINNRELNLLAQEGRIPERIYAVCQDEFFRVNNQLVNQAAERAGYGVSISDAKLNPGTDTDVNVLSKSGKQLRLDDIQKIESQYQGAVREHFLAKDPKLDVPRTRIDTNTDFMPHPQHTAPGEFQKIADHINTTGGTAYTDPRAASAQAKLGTRQPLTFDEASSFGTTMKDMASAKIHNAEGLRKDAQALRGSNPAKAEMLEAQAAQYEYQAAKYHDRLTQLDQQLRNQFKLSDRPGGAVDDAAKKIASIGRNPYSRSELGTIRSLHDNALQRSTDNLIDTLLTSARKDPSRLADVRRIVTEQARSLPMSRAGQAMERLQSTVQKIEAASKWTAFKSAARDLSGVKQLTKVSVVMTAGGALLMGHEGVKAALNDVKATDTVWDFVKNVYIHAGWEGTGIGPAFDRAQAEELARYMKEFENGANPSMVKHVTFTILKSGVYLGQDVLIGVLYLPDSIWEYFTQEKEMEAYAAYQNELAQVMHQMVLDRQAFEQIMTRFRKLGLDEKDTLAFMNCLCRECGGTLGGLYNPGFKGEYGHGPCQCNGPLTIWKTPLPVQNTKVQYACFNAITKMHYDQAQDIFNKWHQQAQQANSASVADDLKAIEVDIRSGKVERDEDVARDIADKIDAIKALLLPQDLDNLRAYVGPHLANHAVKTIATGRIDRAIDDVDRVLKKIGTRHPQEQSNLEATKAQYERWAKAWAETKEKEFPVINQHVDKNQLLKARGLLDALEYRMMKEQPRRLPYADKDPQFATLKERVLGQQKAYQDALNATWAESSAHQKARDPRGALPILQKMLASWEHSLDTAQGLQRQISYFQGEVAKAENFLRQAEQAEKQGDLATTIAHYKASLEIQQDDGLQRRLTQVQAARAEQQQRMVQAKALRDQGAVLQQQGQIPQAIAKYRESLALMPDPALQAHIQNLQTQWDAQQQRLAQAKALRDQGAALQQQGQIPQAIAKYRESLALVPDPALAAHVQALVASLTAQPQPKPQPAPAQPAANIDPTGVWEHSPNASWTLRRLGDRWFAQESGLGNASGPAHWTTQGTLRIDYVTRDGAITGYYDMRFNPDGFTADGRVQELTGPKRSANSHWRRITIHTPDLGPMPVPPTPINPGGRSHTGIEPVQPSIPVAKPGPLLDNGNISSVYNLPTRPTVIRLAQEIVLTSITNYHWNDGRGTPRTGSITLRDASGRSYGPWPTSGRPGQGGVPNAYWTATPNVRMPAGDYVVIDSDPATWSQNSGSDGAGHTRFEGYPTSPTSGGQVATVLLTSPHASPVQPTPQPQPPSQKQANFDGSYVGQFGGDGGGPIRFTVRGANVQGLVNGNIDGDKVTATLSGSVNTAGQITMQVKGTVQWRLSSQSQYSETPFGGQLTGTIQGNQVSGRWTAVSMDQDDKRSGTWTAAR